MCSGTEEESAYEDALCAGALCDLLWVKWSGGSVSDSALIARKLFCQERQDLLAAVSQSRNGRRLLSRPELREDVRFCVQRDVLSTVPGDGRTVPSDGPCDVNLAIVGDNVERLAGNAEDRPSIPADFAKAEGLTPRKGWDPFFPPRLRQFSALAMSPSWSVAPRLCGDPTPHQAGAWLLAIFRKLTATWHTRVFQ